MQYEIILELLKDEDFTLIVNFHDTVSKESFDRVINLDEYRKAMSLE